MMTDTPTRTRAQIRERHARMVAAWAAGASMRAVARAFGVDHKTVDYALSMQRELKAT